ncbi:integrase, catalytic region, zinc finger, CCHC-type containing protein [Tanacetum coccineum]
MSQEKEAQKKFHKTHEDNELEKVIALENKIKVLDDIVYKTGQSVQTMNMLNRNYKTSFVKLEFLKKAQRANPRLYDIGCYNDNLSLMLAPESDETIRLAQESRSKLSDLIRPFDYKNLNNLYDLFIPQREKSPEQRYFSESFEALQQHAIDLELALQQCQEQIKNDKAFKENQSKVFLKEREQYFEIQDLKAQLQDKGIAIGSRSTDLYSITLQDTSTPNPICLMAKASSLKQLQSAYLLRLFTVIPSTCRKTPFQSSTWPGEKPSVKFLQIFGSLCYIVRYGENLDKMKEQDTPPLNIQTTPETTIQAPTQGPTVANNENIIQAETNKEYAQVDKDEFINIFSTPLNGEATDGLSWRNLNNMVGDFSIAKVWDCIRPRSNEIEWYHVVWFANQIPLHAILLWLVLKRKLKTQDTLRHWDVWEHLQQFTYISNISSDLNSIVGFITPLAKMRTIRSVIFKLVFAASSYFIWQERNNRLFNKTKRTHDQLIEIVKNNVRLKLLTCSFKKTANGQLLFDIWKLPESLMRSNHP